MLYYFFFNIIIFCNQLFILKLVFTLNQNSIDDDLVVRMLEQFVQYLFLIFGYQCKSFFYFSLISLSFSACNSFRAFPFNIFYHSFTSLQYCLFQNSGRSGILTSYSVFRYSICASNITLSKLSIFCPKALDPFLYILSKTLALLYVRDFVTSFLT